MRRITLAFAVLLAAISAFAQDPATGLPRFGSFQSSKFDVVNRQNLNVNFSLPIIHSPGRGLDFGFSVVYDSLVWRNVSGVWTPVTDANGTPIWGWKKNTPSGSMSYSSRLWTCVTHPPPDYIEVIEYSVEYFGFIYTDTTGAAHTFSEARYYTDETSCGYSPVGPPAGEVYADDTGGIAYNVQTGKVTIASGTVMTSSSMKDTNGNFNSAVYISSTETDWKDSTGRTAMKIITGSSSIQYQYQDTSGTWRTITLNLQSTNIKRISVVPAWWNIQEQPVYRFRCRCPTASPIPSPTNPHRAIAAITPDG